MRSKLCVGLAAAAVVGLASCGKKDDGGGGTTTISTLAGAECVRYTGGSANFHWSFSDKAFRIEAGADPIPREVLDELVGEGRFAKKVEGAWRLEGMSLILSDVVVDGQSTRREGRMMAAQHEGAIRVTMPARSLEGFIFGAPGSPRQ